MRIVIITTCKSLLITIGVSMQKLSVVVATTILVGVGILNPACADVVKKIYSPYVEAGELEIELQNGIDFDHNQDKDGKIQNKLSVGYGITDRWAAELYGVWEKSGVEGEEAQFTEVSLENRYQLFERGQYSVDVGLYLEVAKSLEHHSPDGIEGKVDISYTWRIIYLNHRVGPYSEGRTLEGLDFLCLPRRCCLGVLKMTWNSSQSVQYRALS